MPFPWSSRGPDSSAPPLPADPQTVEFDFVFFRDLSGRSDARQVIRTVATAFPSVTLDEMSPDQKSWSDLELDAAAGLWADGGRAEPVVSRGQFYARAGPSRVNLAARWARPAQAGSNGFTMTFAKASLEAPAGLEAAIDGLLGVCRGLQPDYARAAAPASSAARGPPDALLDVFWLNYFGRPYVDLFGREQLLAAPALWVRDLGEGVTLAIAESPWESATPASLRRAQDIKRFLGQDAFLDPKAPGRARRRPPLPPA
jgi:hypothetical protein